MSEYVAGDRRINRTLKTLALGNLQHIRRCNGSLRRSAKSSTGRNVGKDALLGRGVEIIKAVRGKLRLIRFLKIHKEEQLIPQAPPRDGNQRAANAAAKVVDA